MRHFATNIWRRQKKKEVVQKLKSLYGCRTKEKFEETLVELQKVLNARAKSWLEDQMPQREKWALAFYQLFRIVQQGVQGYPCSPRVGYCRVLIQEVQ
jgi:hypothetical protein